MSRVDWSAEERKLQGVYDDIQMGNLKIAQSTVDRWLKKHPKSQPALVLRMLLLGKLRQGSRAVLKAYDDVKRTGQLTPRSMWSVGIALKSIRRPDLVLDLYQNLWSARPDVLEMGDQVFLNAAVAGNTEVMASVSRKLFNGTKAPIWARLAAYSAWTHFAPSPSDADPFPVAPPRTLLPAAILLKATGTAVESADQLWLRLQIALGNGDAKGAYELVRTEGRKGSLQRRWAGLQAAKVCAARGLEGVWEEEVDATLAALQVDAEIAHNYAFYAHVLAALDGAYSPERAAKVATVLDSLVVSMAGERAPALARLELDAALRRRGEGLPVPEWEARVRAYLDRWGSKWTTVDELPRIAGDNRGAELRALVAEWKPAHKDERSFCAHAVAELFLLDPEAAGNDAARPFWDLYIRGLAYTADQPKTDVHPADNMGLAAVDIVLRAWAKAPEEDAPLLTAAACLEHILANSPSAFGARFTLVRVYRLLRAPALYLPHLAKLDLTEIQLDNLLHIVSERGGLEARLAGPMAAKTWGDIVAKAATMYQRSVTELPDFVKQALEHESYSKIHGMRTLIKCLDSSVSQRVIELEEVALALATGTEASAATTESLPAALGTDAPFVDNRNFELLVDSLTTAPGQPILPEAAVRALGAVAVRAAAFVQGAPVPDLPVKMDGLSPTDKAYVEALDGVVRRAVDDADGTTVASSTNVYEALLALLPTATGYTRSSTLVTLGQLARTLDAISRRAADLAKPVKGKKRPAGLVALVADLKGARDELRSEIENLDLDEPISTAAWATAAEWTSQEHVDALAGQVTPARREFEAGIQRLLGSKAL